MILRKLAIATMATVMAVVVVACGGEYYTNAAFNDVNPDGWAYGDSLFFENPSSDSIVSGNLVIAVRHTNGYIYRNLWLELTTPTDSTGTKVDTVNILLADIYGKWYSHGSGASYIATDTLDGTFIFERHRPATVRHIMRVDTLSEIEQIGLILIQNQ